MAKFFKFYHTQITNQDKVNFFSAKSTSSSLTKWNIWASLWFCVSERPPAPPKNFFLISAWCKELFRRGSRSRIFIFDKLEYTHGMYRSVILLTIFILHIYATFSLFLKMCLTESILIFREELFREFCFLLASNNLLHKFFQMKISSPH